MPLTFSHPAAAVPLRRLLGRFASLPALVLGSMAPDFPYYLPVSIHRTVTHTLASVVWFSVPAGLVAFLLFDRLLKAPLLFLLPTFVRRRVPPCKPVPLAPVQWLAICISTGAGAFTHVIWDSVTHVDGAAVARLPQLRLVLAHVAGIDFPAFKILQLGSSVAGAALLAFWIWRWVRRTPPALLEVEAPFPDSTRAVIVVACVAMGLIAGLAIGTARAPDLTTARAFQTFLRHTVVSSVATTVAFLLAFSLAWKNRARQSSA